MTFLPRKTLALLLLSSTTALLACQTDGAADRLGGSLAGTSGQAAELETTPAEEQAPLLSDNEIAGVVAAIHEGEISLARLMRERSESPRVLGFAEQMITDHTASLDELDRMRGSNVVPETSTLQQGLTGEALNMEQTLAAADPAEVDRLYLSGQVRMHERAVELMDNELLRGVRSAELSAYLRRLRPVLVGHLEMARELEREQTIARR